MEFTLETHVDLEHVEIDLHQETCGCYQPKMESSPDSRWFPRKCWIEQSRLRSWDRTATRNKRKKWGHLPHIGLGFHLQITEMYGNVVSCYLTSPRICCWPVESSIPALTRRLVPALTWEVLRRNLGIRGSMGGYPWSNGGIFLENHGESIRLS